MKKILVLFVILLLFLSGCKDISGNTTANFGTTQKDKEALDFIKDNYGDLTESGSPRILEEMLTTNVVEFFPIDKVQKYSKTVDKFYVWFVYDNFKKGDPIDIIWTYLETDTEIGKNSVVAGGDFGRSSFSLNKPDAEWPLGEYKVTVKSATATKSITFEVINGNTISIPVPFANYDGESTTTTTMEEVPEEEDSILIGSTTDSGFTVKDTSCTFDGKWSSNWGDMVFEVTGDKVTATYTHDSGKIEGVITGNVLIGTWSESPTYDVPNDAGDVELELSEDCESLSGNWRYGTEGSDWSGGWTGTKLSNSDDSTTKTDSTTPGWYLVKVEDYGDKVVSTHDYYSYDVEYKRGEIITSDVGNKGEIAKVKTTWEDPADFYPAEGEISVKVTKEAIEMATQGLGLGDSSAINIDMADMPIDRGSSSHYYLVDETYGKFFKMQWDDSTGTVKEGTFVAKAPRENAFSGSFRILFSFQNGAHYRTNYVYEWKE